MVDEAPLAVATRLPDPPAAEVRVNFGVFAGREATPAELEALGRALLAIVPEFAITGEQRHFVSTQTEAIVHQVRVELPWTAVSREEDEIERVIGRLLQECEHWARACIAERHVEVGEIG